MSHTLPGQIEQSKNVPMASQQDANPTVAAGYSPVPNVVPDYVVANTNLSVSLQLPIPLHYKHN